MDDGAVGEPLSAAGFRRTMEAARGLRGACWRGAKRPAKRRQWVEFGVNGGGFCVARLFKDAGDSAAASQCNIMGSRLEVKRMDEGKLETGKFGFVVRGQDLTRADSRGAAAPLYVYTSTRREDSVLFNAVQALAASALASGVCRFTGNASGTFAEIRAAAGASEDLDDARSVGSSFSSRSASSSARVFSLPLPMPSFRRLSRTRRKSLSSANSAMAAAKLKLEAQAHLDLAAPPGSPSSSAGSARTGTGGVQSLQSLESMQSMRTTGRRMHSTSSLSLHAGAATAAASDANSGAVDAGAVDAGAVDAGAVDAGAVDAGAVDTNVVTVVQCARYLLDAPGLEQRRLFRALPPREAEEAAALAAEVRRAPRCGLSGRSAEVVADVLADALASMEPALVDEDAFFRYRSALDKHESLGIDPSMSQAALQAACALVTGLGADRAFALRELVALIAAVNWSMGGGGGGRGGGESLSLHQEHEHEHEHEQDRGLAEEAQRHEACCVLGGLVVGSLRKFVWTGTESGAETETETETGARTAVVFPRGRLVRPHTDAVQVLLATLLSEWTGPQLFDAVLFDRDSGQDAARRIRHLCSCIPKSRHGDEEAHAGKDEPHVDESESDESEAEAEAESEAQSRAAAGRSAAVAALLSAAPGLLSASAPSSRKAMLQQQVRWYRRRLGQAPNSRNALLWRREIAEFERELREGVDVDDDDDGGGGGDGTNDVGDGSRLVRRVAALWRKSKESTPAEVIVRATAGDRSADVGKRMNGGGSSSSSSSSSSSGSGCGSGSGSSSESQGKVEGDEYLERPFSAIDSSDVLLGKLLEEAKLLADVSDGEGEGDSVESDLDDVERLLVGLLRENVALRLEVNQVQRGLVERTQEKAREFEEAYFDESSEPRTGAVGAAKPPQERKSTWSTTASFTKLF